MLLLLLAACTPATPPAFGAGRHYHGLLRVTERGPVVPALAAAMPSPRDTAVIELVIDSVRADSSFGQASVDWRRLGSTAGRVGSPGAPFDLEARQIADSLEVRLWPGATDSDVWLHGRRHGDSLVGVWTTTSGPRIAGTFAIAL